MLKIHTPSKKRSLLFLLLFIFLMTSCTFKGSKSTFLRTESSFEKKTIGDLHASTNEELLERFRPHLYATKKEFSPPIAIEAMLENSYLIDLETKEIIRGDDGMSLPLTVDVLRAYDDERYCVKLFKDYTKLFGKNEKENFARSRPVVYGRAIDIPEAGVVSLQFFFFYAGSYTGRLVVGPQVKWHEGDTEYSQILIDAVTHEPLGASSSIHYYGSSFPWQALLKGEDGRVKMYIAQRSHATYFHPSRHQAMEGNLGFGGRLMFSLRTVWDYTHEDREVDYKLRCPGEDHPVFKWKGRWGGMDKLSPNDESAKSHELGPVSFAYRNAMSERLSMWNDPLGFFCFYYLPSDFYQKTLLTLKEIEETTILDAIYEIVLEIGRLRARVDISLYKNYDHLDERQKAILAEAVPYVALSVYRERIAVFYDHGLNKIGKKAYNKLMRNIAKRNIKLLIKHITTKGLNIKDIVKDPIELFKIGPDRLLNLLSKLTDLDEKTIVEIYESSHRFRNSEAEGFSAYHLIHR